MRRSPRRVGWRALARLAYPAPHAPPRQILVATSCTAQSCTLLVEPLLQCFSRGTASSASTAVVKDHFRRCDICGKVADGLAHEGGFACRECRRKSYESKLKPSPSEQQWLDAVAQTLDQHTYDYWKPGDQPARILDWLYLGDLVESLDTKSLKRRGISAVLSAMGWWELSYRLTKIGSHLDPDYLPYYFSNEGIQYCSIDVSDSVQSDLSSPEAWPAADAFLQSCKSQGRTALVHCYKGHNRASALVVCWLVLRERWDLLEALAHVQRLRGCVLSNHGYRLGIVRLAQKSEALGQPRV